MLLSRAQQVSFSGMHRFGCVVIVVGVAGLSGCGGKSLATLDAANSTPTELSPSARVYRVPAGSMERTLGVGAEVVVSPGSPRVGEIVVFHPPVGAEEQECGPTSHVVRPGGRACARPIPREDDGTRFVKRIVAGPGDELYISEGHVFRRSHRGGAFRREKDTYTRACGISQECSFPKPIKIPPGHWYVLGDNRGDSDDSRFWGAVPTPWIVGVVAACYKPPGRPRTLGQLMSARACRLPGGGTQ